MVIKVFHRLLDCKYIIYVFVMMYNFNKTPLTVFDIEFHQDLNKKGNRNIAFKGILAIRILCFIFNVLYIF